MSCTYMNKTLTDDCSQSKCENSLYNRIRVEVVTFLCNLILDNLRMNCPGTHLVGKSSKRVVTFLS